MTQLPPTKFEDSKTFGMPTVDYDTLIYVIFEIQRKQKMIESKDDRDGTLLNKNKHQ